MSASPWRIPDSAVSERVVSKPCDICGARSWMLVQWGGLRPGFVRLFLFHVSETEHHADLQLAAEAPAEPNLDRL
ncbi:MAG: hypothetical protein M3067_05765 [Chloroflexota bacterium]|nr:hypothetical protein [Chloroflexota bacterium]